MTSLDSPVDVLIVGSGPTGAAYARVITDAAPQARVLLVEAGPRLGYPDGLHVTALPEPERDHARVVSQGPDRFPYATPTPAERAAAVDSAVPSLLARPGTFLLGAAAKQPGEDGLPALAMSRNVGGMGSHWTGACPRPGGSERTTELPPDSFDRLLGRAESLLGVTQSAFAAGVLGAGVRHVLGELFDGVRAVERRVQPMPLAIRRTEQNTLEWSGPAVVLGPIASVSAHFELRPETVCRKLIMDGDRAVGAELIDVRTGASYQIDCRFAVVAGDALRTPQLLYASGLRRPALGRYLNDQAQLVTSVQLSAAVLAQAGDTDPANSTGVSWVPFDEPDFPFHGQVMQADTSPIALSSGHAVRPGSIVGLGWFCAKDLSVHDRVTFSDEDTDDLGLPAMSIHYRLSDRDLAMIDAARSSMTKVVERLGTPVGADEPVLLPLGSSLHYQGTVRMGTRDDGQSVCDPHSMIWGTDNVYVAGNGVIAAPTACNPTLTSVALAIGAAEHLASRV